MKLIGTPALEKQVCEKCGALVEIKWSDVKYDRMLLYKKYWKCPVCKYPGNIAKTFGQELSECIKRYGDKNNGSY